MIAGGVFNSASVQTVISLGGTFVYCLKAVGNPKVDTEIRAVAKSDDVFDQSELQNRAFGYFPLCTQGYLI